MKVNQQINFIVMNKQADSLHSLIADGQNRSTSLGRNTWKSLLGSQVSLQINCNREGFNVEGDRPSDPKARIDIITNNENHCDNCDSVIGFGMAGRDEYYHTSYFKFNYLTGLEHVEDSNWVTGFFAAKL